MTIPVTKLPDDPIVVVCAADNNYAMPLSVTIRSALENLGSDRHLLLFVIDGGMSERNKQRFLKSIDLEKCEIRWLSQPEALINEAVIPTNVYLAAPEVKHITITAWYRLLIPDLLPAYIKKAIYLDCDLVVAGDLGELWDIDIKDNYLLAVWRIKRLLNRRACHILSNWKELGLSEDDKYFNSGVLVLNLEKWRSENLCIKSLKYIAEKQQYIPWGDQDVLNAIVAGHWAELDPKWNCMAADLQSMTKEEVASLSILHFSTAAKPWIAIEQYPATDLFFHYLEMTDWSGYKHTVPQRLWRRLKREVKNFQKQSLSK